MARILYGVMSRSNGHLTRALAVARRLPEHEFYFVGGDRIRTVVGDRYPVLTVPDLHTVYRNQRVHLPATVCQGLRSLAAIPTGRRQVLGLIERWQPNLAFCDFELCVPLAARAAGLKCVSIDHQHILRATRYPVPASQKVSRWLALASAYLFYNFTRHNLIVSFFQPDLKLNRSRNELLPPILRPTVTEITARAGNHVLIYQTTPTFTGLLDAARQLSRPVIVYGMRSAPAVEGNITFKSFDPRGILEDLAGCAYVVVNGGHNVICESLYYGKPVLSFPIALDFEQFLNAWHVRALGYGDFSTSRAPTPELFQRFERQVDDYRANISQKFVDGTARVVERVRELISEQARR
jgi:uncharacterized protein (TIGR00661 family)